MSAMAYKKTCGIILTRFYFYPKEKDRFLFFEKGTPQYKR
jgi:hypothetical protein